MSYQPIRWDNVPSSSLSEASRPLDAAARAFDMGFGAIRGVLDQRSQIQDQNFAATVKNNTNAEMNRLMTADSVDGFKAAKQGLAERLDGLGASIDQSAIRNFADQRNSVLQDRALKDISYNHAVLDESQAKDRDRILGMINSGDKAQIDAAMKELPGMDLRVKADLYKNGNDSQRQLIERAHADESHKVGMENIHSEIARRAAETQIGFANVEVAKRNASVGERQATVQEAQAMAAQQDRLEQRLAKLREERMDTFKASAGSEKGLAAIQDAIKLLKDGNDQDNAREAATRAIKENPNATTEAVIRGVMGMRTHWYSFDALNRQDLVDTVSGSKLTPAEVKAAEARRSEVDASINGVKQQLVTLAGGYTPAAPFNGKGGKGGPVVAGGGDSVLNPVDNGVRFDPATKKAYNVGYEYGSAQDPAQRDVVLNGLKTRIFADGGGYQTQGEDGRWTYHTGVPTGADPAASSQSAPAAPAPAPLPPAQQRLADLEARWKNTTPVWGQPSSLPSQISDARAAANEEARQMQAQQEAAQRAAAKAEYAARAAEANKRNQANYDRQIALNNSAREAALARQGASKEQKKQDQIASLKANISMYESRKGIGDVQAAKEAKDELKKLLGN